MGEHVPDSVIFENAIKVIEERGWGSGGRNGMCIWTAVYEGAPKTMEYDLVDNTYVSHLANLLTDHFGVAHLGEVFHLNDKQSEKDGKRWAIMHLADLRDQAKREESGQPPIKRTFFSRLWDAFTGKW